MVTAGDDIDTCTDNLLEEVLGYPGALGCILAIGYDELDTVAGNVIAQKFLYGRPPGLAYDIADK